MEKTLVINNVKEVYEFVSECNRTPKSFDIYASRDKIAVPCISVMGMFSLDPSIPFTINYPTGKDMEGFEQYITKFEVK